jgi:hypothetical protein
MIVLDSPGGLPMPTSDEPLHLAEDEGSGDRFLIYQTPQGTRLELQHQGDTFWMSQAQIADLFGIDVRTVSEHLTNIYSEGELAQEATLRNFRIVRTEGGREIAREINHYNLDAVISVGYRVNSKQGTLFRKWATGVLVQLATKGFVVDVPRLKNPAEHDRLAELREIIRDIRASESNLYAELRHVCALCQDYDPASQAAREFYSHMQAKLFYAVVSKTPSEIVADRANAALPHMGLQTWSFDEIRKKDAIVAKNYLVPVEIEELNRLTSLLLDIFEDQLKIGRLTLMTEARSLLDAQLRQLGRSVLTHGGSISHAQAEAVAETEYAKFAAIRREYHIRDTQQELAKLRQATDRLPKPK